MNAAQARKLVKICAVAVGVLGAAALAGLIWVLPPTQRKDGLIGMGAALLLLGGGLFGIYRLTRKMEREDAEAEAADRRG